MDDIQSVGLNWYNDFLGTNGGQGYANEIGDPVAPRDQLLADFNNYLYNFKDSVPVFLTEATPTTSLSKKLIATKDVLSPFTIPW